MSDQLFQRWNCSGIPEKTTVCAYAYHMIPRRRRTSRLFVQNSPIILVYNGPPLLSRPCRPSALHLVV